MFASKATRHDGSWHTIANVETTSGFTSCIKTWDRFSENIEHLSVFVNTQTAREVVHKQHNLNRVERSLFDFVQHICGLIEIFILFLITEMVEFLDGFH